jgi:hypothetical membrane protein
MHLIRPEYDPVAETVSQYAIGPYGYLMTAAFFSVGVGVVALAIGLSQALPQAPRIGSAFLGLGGLCVFFVGVFPIDRASPEAPVAEFVHDALSMASIVFAIAAMFTLTRYLSRDSGRRAAGAISLLLSLAATAGLVTLILVYDTHWRGAAQRLCIGAVLSWLLLMATLLQSLDPRTLLRWRSQRHSLG